MKRKRKETKNKPDQIYIILQFIDHFRFISFVGVRGKEVKMSGISG